MAIINNKVRGENAFQVMSHSLIIGPSEAGYTLAYSADGENYTEYSEAVPANENCIVNGVAFGTYIKLVGNTGEVVVSY